MNKKNFSALATLSVLVALSACSSPKDANKDNFGKVIQSSLKEDKALCVRVMGVRFPHSVPLKYAEKDSSAKYLKALEKAGLLVSSEREIEYKDRWDIRARNQKVPGLVYEVSDEGKKYLDQNSFCTGGWKLTSVDSFTEPAQMMGSTISRVNFRKVMVDAASWAESAELAQVYPGAFRSVDGEQKSQAVLVLANDGWVDGREFKGH